MRALKPRMKLFGFVAALLAGVVLVGVDEAGAQMMGIGSITGGVVGAPITHLPPVATRDHRTPRPVATRDHRTPPPVTTRDHRTNHSVGWDYGTSGRPRGAPTVEVRDHGASRSVEVRDHGANRIATVPVTVTRSHK
jgi:hypothetical protein